MYSKKAIIEIVGGLGNQFFIYTCAKKLEEEKGFDLKFDAAYYSWWPRRKNFARTFDLQHFKCDIPLATEREVRKTIWRTNNRTINSLLKKHEYFSKKFRKFQEVLPKDNAELLYFSGFKTHTKYILKNLEKFRRAFSLKNEYLREIKKTLEKIKGGNSVSINVRRGDILEFKDSNVIGVDYYKKAIEIIQREVKKPKFYVFSDDINWCKDNFEFIDNVEFIEGNTVSQDIELMKNCKHNILANSSLSWWAGVLNSNKKKIVVAPINFRNRRTHSNPSKDFFPEDWILI